MRKIIFILFTFSIHFVSGQDPQLENGNNGYQINVQIKPFKNQYVYLGHYFGNEYPVIDSALLDENSQAVFKGDKKLPGGIYLLFYPDQTGAVDLLLDKNQFFSVTVDMSGPEEFLLRFDDSPENNLLNQYEQFVAFHYQALENANQELAYAVNVSDSLFWRKKLDSIDLVIQEFREDIIKKNPESFLSTLLISMREPILPDSLKPAKNHSDSMLARRILKDNFWNGVNFWDGRLTYTPFFDEKIEKYFNELLDPTTDSVIKEIDMMLGFAANNDLMSHYLLNKFLIGTMYHHFKWEDAVFIHLYEKYIASKTYNWLSEQDKKIIADRAYFLIGNNKGKLATNIILPDNKGINKSLNDVNAKYTLISFWDPTCEHCIETLPKLDSIYRKKWKSSGLKIFSVAVESDGTKQDWLNFIKVNDLLEWSNVYHSIEYERKEAEAGKKLILNEYDVWYFPTFFLLDKDKHYMAKKLSFNQIVDLLEVILKKN